MTAYLVVAAMILGPIIFAALVVGFSERDRNRLDAQGRQRLGDLNTARAMGFHHDRPPRSPGRARGG